ncbi:MAG TPA: hypothetical protein VGI70_06080 [Polyangiales bacterium]
MANTSHAYAAELAEFAYARWQKLERQDDPGPCNPRPGALPELGALRQLLSVAYQASLMREEDRPVRFRLYVGPPEALRPDIGPPEGLQCLRFDRARTFDPHELRRLSPAVKYHRALIGVRSLAGDDFEIWGMLQSGPRWLQSARGGRALASPIPADAIVVRVQGPGNIAVAVGDVTLVELRAGKLSGGSADVFQATWLAERFASSRAEMMVEHERTLLGPSIPLEEDATRIVSQQMVKRLLATVQETRHGGSLVFLPHARADALLAEGRLIHLKYAFAPEEPRRRYRTLILAVMKELVAAGLEQAVRPERVGWHLYQGTRRPGLAALDEAILEMSQLMAALTEVDGCTLLNERFEVIGFGGEITGSLAEVDVIRRARDLECEQFDLVAIDGVGTRHRAAYRLCAEEHGALAVVVSQDGSVQFVAWHRGALTYWEHGNVQG